MPEHGSDSGEEETDNAQRQSNSGPSIRPEFQHPSARVGGVGTSTGGVVRVLAVLVHVCWVRAYDTLLMTHSLRFSDNSRGYTDCDASTTPVQDTGSNTISIPLGTAASYLIHANG